MLLIQGLLQKWMRAFKCIPLQNWRVSRAYPVTQQKIACPVICIIWLGFEIKEQKDGYPFWYTRPPWERGFVLISLEGLLWGRQISYPRTISYCSHFLFFWEDYLAVWAGPETEQAPPKWAPMAGQCDQGKCCQVKYHKRCMCCIAHSHIGSKLPNTLFCLFFLWVYMKRPVCYNIDSSWEVIRHRGGPREARGR